MILMDFIDTKSCYGFTISHIFDRRFRVGWIVKLKVSKKDHDSFSDWLGDMIGRRLDGNYYLLGREGTK